MHRRVLVVAAHPDDEVLGCGASISKHVFLKDAVWILILGEGVRSRRGLPTSAQDKKISRLRSDCLKASKILGVQKTILKNFPDNRFDSVPLLDITHEIEKVADEFGPNIVYTHSKADVNIDHRKTLEALEPVVRPYANRGLIAGVYSFEVPSSTEVNFVRKTFSPNYFVKVDKRFLDAKVKALEAYSGEIRSFPHPRSSKYLTKLAGVRGAQAGVRYAEAYEVVFCLDR